MLRGPGFRICGLGIRPAGFEFNLQVLSLQDCTAETASTCGSRLVTALQSSPPNEHHQHNVPYQRPSASTAVSIKRIVIPHSFRECWLRGPRFEGICTYDCPHQYLSDDKYFMNTFSGNKDRYNEKIPQ